MVQTLNFINLSSQQAPNDVDWAGLVKAGVQGALIRLGHGIIRDPCASGHIAKAKQYGLYWHGYHTYEGVVNEPQFTIKNATELGLSNSQYYFADLTKSSDPFNDYYALHATWLSQGYSTGLLISNDDYLSKFNDSEVIASGTLRWLISDTEPDGYDVWQYSSEGTVGISSVKVGFNFSKTDKLKYNLDTTLTGADINKDPYNPETPVGGAYIGWGYDTTGLGGGKTIGYSTDGKNFYALIGPDGLIVRKSDGNRIYGTISDQIDSAISANVIPAKSAADSAVSAANAAVESAQVTSDAVTAIASATAEAKQGANEAMSRAESAWDVATGAKEAVTDFDPLLKSAQSDAKQANETATSAYEQSRSAYDAVKADSSAVVAMQSSMADFQEDVASAQSVADSAKADAGKALTQIADTANALSDAKTAFNSGVAEAKQLASTAQTTADSAVESAGENAKALTSQANALSDVKKAMDSGVASATGLANAAQATADNAVKSASSVANDLAAVASQANANASGITKVTSDVGLLQTTVADTASALNDAKTAFNSQAAEAKQLANTAQTTADNSVKSASSVANDLTAVSSQVKSNASGITKVTSDVGLLQTTVADNSGNISKIQETAAQIQQAVSDNAGNITVAKQTADSAVAVASDASSNATVAIQTASQASITASNASGQAASAVITAQGALTTASNAKSDATVAVQTASGASLTATNAQSDATIAKQTASEATVQASNAESDVAQLSIRANKIEANVADNSGNISKIQETATQIQQAVSDNAGNITIAKQTADSAVAVASDAKSNATVAVQTASGASVTAKNAQGDATTAITTAQSAVTQASDAKSNATIAVQTASEASVTATNAQGDASVAKQTASDASVQIKNAQGDISKLQTRAGTIEASVSSNSGAIADVQATANQLKASVSDNAGNITVAKQTADSAVAVASDARSNATVASQTASQASLTAQNASGQAASAVLTANGAMATASDAKSDATVAVQTASEASLTATNAQSDATIAKQTASEATVQASNAESDFAQLSIRANKIEANVATNSGAIASVQQTASGLTTTVGNVDNRVKTIEDKTNWTTKTGSLDMDTLTTTQNIYYRDTNLQNADGETGWAYIQVVSMGERVTQTVWHDRSSIQHTRTGAVSGSSYNWDAWNKTATYAQVTEVKQTVNGLSTLVNDPKTGMTATYQTASQASLTAQNASGQAVTAVTTAQGAVTTAKNAQSDAVVAKQTASEANVTASNAAGDASVAKQTASQASISVQNAQSDITSLDARADSLEAFQKDASGNINKLVSRADGVDRTLTDQAGDISSLQSRAGKLEISMSTANGQISTFQQTASGLTTSVSSISDQLKASGHKVKVQSSTFNTSANYSDAGVWLDGTRVGSIGGGISFTMGTLNLDWSGYTQKDYATTSSLVSDLLALQDKIVVIYMADAIPSYGSDLVNALAKMGGDSKLATATSVSYRRSPFIFIGMSLDTNGKQVLQEGEGYLNTGTVGDGQVKYAWGYEGDSNKILTSSTIGKVTEIKTTIDGINTTINDPKTGLNATYQTAQGNTTTISSVKGDVSQLQATANGLTSRVGNLESKTNTQQTTIDQNKAAIALKADQTTVDTLKGTVNQNTATLKTQADQINSKVTRSDVTGMLTGYATQTYTQSLISQNAGSINETITQLDTKFKTGMENSIQLVRKSDFEDGDKGNWTVQAVVSATNPAPPAELGQSGMKVLQTNTRDGYEDGIWYSVKPGEKFDVDYWCAPSTAFHTTFGLVFADKDNNWQWQGISSDQSGQWGHYTGTITAPANASFAKPWYQMEKPGDNTTNSSWIAKPSIRRQNASTISAIQSVQASVDGLKSIVANKTDESQFTQLSNLVQTKVSSDDFTSTTTQLKNEINQRVQVGDVISQINQEAGGDTLIQVSNGKKSLILDAGNTIFTGKAWIPVAAIADLTSDQIQAGTLSGSKVHAGDNSGNAIDMGALSTDYVGFHAYANNGDNTYIDLNGIHNYGANYDTRIQQGKITTNYLAVNGGGMIDFRDSNGTGMVANGSTLTFDVNNTPAGYLSYNGMPVAELPDGSGGNELAIRYGLSAAIIPDDSSGAQATFSGAAQKIGYMTGTNQGKQMLSGLEVHSNNHHWFGAVNSDATWNRIEINSNDGVNLAWHDQTHFWISDGKAKLYKDNNDSQTATELEVHGWAWINGWVEAAGHSQHSTLSSKTRIEEADPDYMLDLVNNTDLTTFAFKSEVAEGLVVRHIGPIIDDVNDVAQYRTPAEFIAPTKTARDDDNMIGALFGAVQALTKRIKKLEDKLNG